MNTSSIAKSSKHARQPAISDEQTLCLEALESGAYDSMSDQEWVALCEKLASDSRHHDDESEPDKIHVAQLMAAKKT